MRKILSCAFNLDTACVELHLEDGTLLSIDCTAVENEVANSMYQRSELDWLIYNDPLAYVELIFNGEPELYLKVVTEHMMRISLTTQKAIPEYIIKYLNSVIGVQELRKNAKQAVNQASINQQDVKNVAIKLPKLEEQAEIVRIVDDLLVREQQAKEAAEGVLEKIDLIKKAILARAFRGELGTNDPSEESAVGLLKTCYCGKLQS